MLAEDGLLMSRWSRKDGKSEWSSDAAYSASAGSNVASTGLTDTTFKRLPFNFCSISLQPFTTPVCTPHGTIFDIDNILPWLLQHGTDPSTGKKLQVDELIRLKFAKNEQGDYIDPVTYKVLTNNTHIAAIKNSGNVFAYDTVERLNIKAKLWKDLVSDEDFTRKDVIILQDPQNLESRNLSSFKHIKEGTRIVTPEQERQRNAGVNRSALGSAASVLKDPSSKPEIGKYLAQTRNDSTSAGSSANAVSKGRTNGASKAAPSLKPTAQHTTGRAAASLTSTGLTPHTSAALAELSQEDFLLKPKKIKQSGLVTLNTTFGPLNLELDAFHSPRTVWNFLTLTKRGYYNDCSFHRSIPNFMLQGGDPTGTGRGGESSWKAPFKDEWIHAPQLSHDKRGVLSMANKGRDTNTSQFFLTYRPAKHLDRKHTIFGRLVIEDAGSEETFKRIESVERGDKDRPVQEIKIEDIAVLVDPFEEYQKEDVLAKERAEKEGEEGDNDRVTWTGKRIGNGASEEGPGVGLYLDANTKRAASGFSEEWELAAEEPVAKKSKKGGGAFGNFDSW
ncbi:uncharacterized protein KY384_005038 [Bacidia gigantensis]|uniref:uncharacterized protein n=1 Tax=Bacidia gigantensis TaxID=2732470 RepID=UPI001D05510A|nr:uncharacterized protein KY384_005038 [Bacidia gigantensis]KAG8530535.1 hypothetical protein KY384_005038 [Bacidia gigantensis]